MVSTFRKLPTNNKIKRTWCVFSDAPLDVTSALDDVLQRLSRLRQRLRVSKMSARAATGSEVPESKGRALVRSVKKSPTLWHETGIGAPAAECDPAALATRRPRR